MAQGGGERQRTACSAGTQHTQHPTRHNTRCAGPASAWWYKGCLRGSCCTLSTHVTPAVRSQSSLGRSQRSDSSLKGRFQCAWLWHQRQARLVRLVERALHLACDLNWPVHGSQQGRVGVGLALYDAVGARLPASMAALCHDHLQTWVTRVRGPSRDRAQIVRTLRRGWVRTQLNAAIVRGGLSRRRAPPAGRGLH
eukprot:350521-Chlamydomonas_euryale.AAC.19